MSNIAKITPVANASYTNTALTPTSDIPIPPNGNSGVVPPWMHNKSLSPNVVGGSPASPDTPHIM